MDIPGIRRALATLFFSFVLISSDVASATVTLDLRSLGAHVDEAAVTVTLIVDAAAAAASDANSGSAALPLRTVGRAAALAMEYNERGVGVRVKIAPGTYREAVQLSSSARATTAPMIFEATDGAATITGSDLWTGWHADSPQGTYSHDWPYAWGLVPYPPDWECCVVLRDRLRRREMIFVNGTRLRQVMSRDALRPGSFFVSEASRQVYVHPPAGVEMDHATAEVAVRSSLFEVRPRSNVVLRGLTFTHDNSGIGGGAAVAVYNSTNVLIEDAVMTWNNDKGLTLAEDDHVTVQRSVANSNGLLGMAGRRLTFALFSDNETSYNNWRGADDELTDREPAGTRLMLLRDTAVVRHTLNGNSSSGLWLDTDCVDVLLDSVTATNNLHDGLVLQAVQGPITIAHSGMAGNRRAGIVAGNAANVDVRSTVLSDNGVAQLLISGSPDGSPVDDYKTGQRYIVQTTNWTLTGNTISAGEPEQALLSTTLSMQTWQPFIASLSSDENTWGLPPDRNGFRWVDGARIDCATWQQLTRQDGRSRCIVPPGRPKVMRSSP